MAVLLHILVETLVLTFFLWIGQSIMKAEVSLKTLLITAAAGALASQVLFIGTYLSLAVICFFLWKMARVDIVPDGFLILIIGKGAGLIVMIYGYAYAVDHLNVNDASPVSQIPIYMDEAGTRYYAEGDRMYYLDDNQEKVFVEAEAVFGVSEMMEVANNQGQGGVAPDAPAAAPETPQPAGEAGDKGSAEGQSVTERFSEPFVSDTVIRGNPMPYELFVPQGWKTFQREGEVAIRYKDHTFLRCFARRDASENNRYLRDEVDRMLSQRPAYQLARQEIVTIDGKQWAQIQFVNPEGDQVLLLTHADRFGSYSLELSGSHAQLSGMKEVLNRMIFSFNFPPTTYFLAQLEAQE